MAAERVNTEVVTGIRLLPPREAESRLYDIWHGFEMSPRLPQDVGKRSNALRELGQVLSLEAQEYLQEDVEVVGGGGVKHVARGLLIKERATREARGALREKKASVLTAKEEAAKASPSQKARVRRQKAYERRGTDPRRIR